MDVLTFCVTSSQDTPRRVIRKVMTVDFQSRLNSLIPAEKCRPCRCTDSTGNRKETWYHPVLSEKTSPVILLFSISRTSCRPLRTLPSASWK